jgi:laminin alpha 3/5
MINYVMKECNCDNRYSTGNCAQLTGKCECKPQYEGDRCEKYWFS